MQIHPLRWPSSSEHLLLFGAELACLERGRFLHRCQCEQLQQVVLDDIAGDADAIEVTGAAADPDVLRHRDLDMVDVVVVPHRLEQLIREPQRHHVLHGFFAEVMVDAKHRGGGEDAGDDPVQFSRGLQVVAKRLFDHHPAPPAGMLLSQSVRAQLVNDRLEQPRRDGQVERVVPAGTAGLVEIDDRLGEPAEGLLVTTLPDEPDAFG